MKKVNFGALVGIAERVKFYTHTNPYRVRAVEHKYASFLLRGIWMTAGDWVKGFDLIAENALLQVSYSVVRSKRGNTYTNATEISLPDEY